MQDSTQDRMSLYNQGLDDTQIARIQGVSPSAICHWRQKKQLESNSRGSERSKAELTKGRKFLYDLNWGDNSIAWQQQVTRVSVRVWRETHGLPANRPSVRTWKRDKLEQLHELQRRVRKAVGSSLPVDIAADAAAELMLAVVDGTVAIADIEKAGRSYGNQALQQYANAYLSKSLDEAVEGTNGLTRIDMLRDEASEQWLEEMGASWH